VSPKERAQTWRAADPHPTWWQFWRDDAPEITLTFSVIGDHSAASVAEVINQELARVLARQSRPEAPP